MVDIIGRNLVVTRNIIAGTNIQTPIFFSVIVSGGASPKG
jgi:hypothetical protein